MTGLKREREKREKGRKTEKGGPSDTPPMFPIKVPWQSTGRRACLWRIIKAVDVM